MDWSINNFVAREVTECMGIATASPMADWLSVDEHPTFVCEHRTDTSCLEYGSNCVLCKIEDQDILREAWKWIRSALCAVHGVHTYQDIFRQSGQFGWIAPSSNSFNIEKLANVLNDGIWTTAELPEEYCDVIDCCYDEQISDYLLDKYRLIPDLDFCTDSYDRFPSANSYCDPRIDRIRQMDSERTTPDTSEELSFGVLSRRVALRILGQLNSLKTLTSLMFIDPAVTGPFFEGHYPEIMTCEYKLCHRVHGVTVTDTITSSWLDTYGLVRQSSHSRYMESRIMIYLLLVFFVVTPILPIIILKVHNYLHLKKHFEENRATRKRLKIIENTRLKNKKGLESYRADAAITYIQNRLDRDTLRLKLAQVQHEDQVPDFEESSSFE
eukprot:GHVH01006802.1.p1 GENE.GHVH01006802.1~~GHVH01006802.1.p1  ORF type:complete len:384 (+),score=28.59 GHVH01006802.1:664-1815(+)